MKLTKVLVMSRSSVTSARSIKVRLLFFSWQDRFSGFSLHYINLSLQWYVSINTITKRCMSPNACDELMQLFWRPIVGTNTIANF